MDILSFILGYNKGKAQGGSGSSTEKDIFALQTVDGFVEDTEMLIGTYYAYFPNVFEIKEGETYYVKWDGTTYTCKGISASLNGQNFVYLGDGSMLGYEGNNEPFAIIYSPDNGFLEAVAFNDTNPSHEIRVYQTVSNIEIKPLTITKNGTFTAPDGQAYSPITVSVPSDATIDFPYELKEILPETELTFGFGNSPKFPVTPTAVVADAETVKSMEILEEGDGGLVVWDGKIYPVYAGKKNTPPLVVPESGKTWTMEINPCVGNSSIFTVWQMFDTVQLVKPRLDITTIDQVVVDMANAGASSEPFFITTYSDYGYVFCSSEKSSFISVYESYFGEVYDSQYNGLFVGYNSSNIASNTSLLIDNDYTVRWGNEIYSCTPIEKTIETSEFDENNQPITKNILYLGNSKAFGGEDTGEPFAAVWGLVEGKVVVVMFDEYATDDTNKNRRLFGVYDYTERTHTVQIFKFV